MLLFRPYSYLRAIFNWPFLFILTKPADLIARARRIRLVLTDGGVYYSGRGEEMKCFGIRDGTGVVRPRKHGIALGIITGEVSPSVRTRAAKLQIEELYFGIKRKPSCLRGTMARTGIRADKTAFIGGATSFACAAAGFHCQAMGGHGYLRELAEFIIAALGGEAVK